MKTLLKISLTIILSSFAGCNEHKNSKTMVATSPSAPPLPSAKSDIKIKPEFFILANKSAAEIEKRYGLHNFEDTKFVQAKDGGSKNGKFRLYTISGGDNLQIDFYNDKAVGVYYQIPKEFQTKSLEDTLKFCGFNVSLSDAQSEQAGYWWKNPAKAKPFDTIRVQRYDDSGLFYNCEAHIKA